MDTARIRAFVEKLADVRRIYLALPEPLDIAYAIGALAGWPHVDLQARRIHVRESVKRPLKDKHSRVVSWTRSAPRSRSTPRLATRSPRR